MATASVLLPSGATEDRAAGTASDRIRKLDLVRRQGRLDLFRRDDHYAGQLLHQGDRAVIIATSIPPRLFGTQPHAHVVEQAFVVIEGEVTLAIEGIDHRVVAGEVLVVPRGLSHGTRNDGEVPTLYLEVLAPAPTMFSSLLAKEGAFIDRRPDAAPLITPPGSLAAAVRGADGGRHRSLAGPALGCASVAVQHVELAAGQAEAGLRAFRSDRFLYVAEGEVAVRFAAERHRVGPHTLVILPGGVPHAIGNAGPGPARFFDIETPPGGAVDEVRIDFVAAG